MEIKEFISRFGRDDLEKVARKAGTTIEYLADQVANGHRKPSPKLARRISLASKGKITLAGLRPDLWGGT